MLIFEETTLNHDEINSTFINVNMKNFETKNFANQFGKRLEKHLNEKSNLLDTD